MGLKGEDGGEAREITVGVSVAAACHVCPAGCVCDAVLSLFLMGVVVVELKEKVEGDVGLVARLDQG